ncbi:hypothetical protein C8J57DRAFT_1559455 [Mycena rebaudengoi]|nr:hypothetical protein C8J57DRAFT_1559455 [Mycena rebaudengoi]
MNLLQDQYSIARLQLVADQRLSHTLFLLGLVIPCYDHILTLSDEIRYIWMRPKLRSSYWFLLNRYLALSVNIFNAISIFRPADPQGCMFHVSIRPKGVGSANAACNLLYVQTAVSFLYDSLQFVVQVILSIRVFAMYNLSKRLMIVLSVCGLTALGIGAWLITTVNPPSLLSIDDQVYGPGGGDLIMPQCTNLVYPESAKRVAGAWLIQLGLDLLIFGLTLRRGLVHKSRANNPFSLIHCLVRDGAIYFAVILSLNIMNILMLLLGRHLLAASVSWMTSSIPSAMVSRLMLNLHQVADAGIHHTTYDVDSEMRFRSPPIELDVLDLHRTTDED